MELLRDDPIVECIMRTGFPPWQMPPDYEDDEEWEEDDCDVFFGNQTEAF